MTATTPSPGCYHYTNFKYTDLTLRVYTADPGHLVWLKEFLCPQFEQGDHGPFEGAVVLVEDTARYQALLGRGPQPDGAELDCFALDSSVIRVPVWTSSGDDLTLFDEKFGVLYLISPDRTEVRILTKAGNKRARIPLMRVLREFAMNYVMRSGGLIIHGAAFTVGGQGVIIAGPKRAGKTTLLIHMLRREATRYVSNDRVLVSFTDTGPLLRGMPTITTIRPPTLAMFPTLRQALLTSTYHHHFTLDESNARSRLVRPWQDGRIGLTPAQFCTLLDTPSTAEGAASALILPQVTGTAGTLDLEPISAEEAANRLSGALFGATCWQYPAEVFNLPHEAGYPDASALHDRCLALALQIPCFVCHLGTEAYTREAATQTFLHEVFNQDAVRVDA